MLLRCYHFSLGVVYLKFYTILLCHNEVYGIFRNSHLIKYIKYNSPAKQKVDPKKVLIGWICDYSWSLHQSMHNSFL